MRLAHTHSVSLVGLTATMVEVQVWFGPGLPRTVIVGLGDASVQEARERCRAAVASTGLPWPTQAVTVNLTPADVRKAGAHYDLPIVLGLLAAQGVITHETLAGAVFLGELGLDGRLRPVRGVLPALLAARNAGFERAVVPATQLREAQLVEGLRVEGLRHLADVVAVLRGEPVPAVDVPAPAAQDVTPPPDLADVVGQEEAKWALEVAAAGRHHLALEGPPGVGKTLLAERLPGILPDLTRDESLQVSAIHSLVGRSLEAGLITRPPYADPHHTASRAAIVGGGAGVAMPGAITLAHAGVLFLDEAPEFPSTVLEGLRTPLESGRVVHGRARAVTTYPARFQLVTAANPCPCGWHGDSRSRCQCSPMAVRRYGERLSGPILDRIDIVQHLRPLKRSYLRAAALATEPSERVAGRVLQARERQRRRLAAFGFLTNAEVSGPVLRRELPMPTGVDAVEAAVARGQLSARGVDKVFRLAWTVADLAGHDRPTSADLHTALAMRRGESREASGAL